MANTFNDTMTSLGMSSWWLLNEAGEGAAVTFADSGVNGYDLQPNQGGNSHEYPMPGLAEGSPRVGGAWGAGGGAFDGAIQSDASEGYDFATWANGGIGCFFKLGGFQASHTLFTHKADSITGAVYIAFTIDTGGLGGDAILRAKASSNSTIFVQFELDLLANDIAYNGERGIYAFMQYVSGDQWRLYINGVDRTADATATVNGTGITVASNMAALIAAPGSGATGAGIHTLVGPGGSPQGGITQFQNDDSCIVSMPHILYNDELTEAEVLSIYESVGWGNGHDDYMEWAMQNIVSVGRFVSLNGGVGENNDRPPVYYQGPDSNVLSAFVSQTAADFVPDTSFTTAYPKDAWEFDGNEVMRNFNGQMPFYATGDLGVGQSIGTMCLIFDYDEAPSTTYYYMAGADANGSEIQIRVEPGVGTEGQLFFRVEDAGGTLIYEAWTDTGVGIGLTTVFHIVANQGDGYKFYINGDPVSMTEVTNTDDTKWFADLGWTAGGAFSQNWYMFGGFFLGDSNISRTFREFWYINDIAWTPEQVTEHWDAISGVFPIPSNINDLAPPTGFYNTIITIGNAADPNGPGPDHYWRMNTEASPLVDIGISVVDGGSITEGGDPEYRASGPLVSDPSNFAVFFDGAGDYFQIGVDGAPGSLVGSATQGTVMFFAALRALGEGEVNIAYGESDATATEFFELGVDEEDKPYLYMQKSSTDWIKFQAPDAIVDLGFDWVVITNDGTNWLMYINNVLVDAVITTSTVTTLSEGDWFAAITTTTSAIAARAATGFPQEANGRFSEIAIWDEAVPASAIGALWAAALDDGVAGTASETATLVFENVIFINGGQADIKASNAIDGFAQTLQVDRSVFFRGGAGGSDRQSIKLIGEVRAQIHASAFNLDQPAAFDGRPAIVATQPDPSVGAVNYGSMIVTDCTFDRMGSAAQGAIFIESGFDFTVQKNRFFDCAGAAVAWAADARRVMVLKNMIDTLTDSIAAIRSQPSANSNRGSGWLIAGNSMRGIAEGIRMDGLSGLAAKNVQILRNLITDLTEEGIVATNVEDLMIARNMINGGTVGISISDIAGAVMLQRNLVNGHSSLGIQMAATAIRNANLVISGNTIDGETVGNGILVTNVDRLVVTKNELLRTPNGIQVGVVNLSGVIQGNDLVTVSNPLTYLASTSRTSFRIGKNNWPGPGDAKALTVASETIEVQATWHTVTAGAPTNLATINGRFFDGNLVILLLAPGSSNITVVNSGNINLNGGLSYVMGTPGQSQIWLSYDLATNSWNEVTRAV